MAKRGRRKGWVGSPEACLRAYFYHQEEDRLSLRCEPVTVTWRDGSRERAQVPAAETVLDLLEICPPPDTYIDPRSEIPNDEILRAWRRKLRRYAERGRQLWESGEWEVAREVTVRFTPAGNVSPLPPSELTRYFFRKKSV